MLVHDFLGRSAERFPEKVALICGGERLSYAELDERANRFAHALIAQGVRRHDRVAIWLPNCTAAVVAIFGALKAGAVFVVVNHSTKADKLRFILDDCAARALVAPARAAATVNEVSQSLPELAAAILVGMPEVAEARKPVLGQDFDMLFAAHAATPPAVGTIDQDLACLIYTSGSTGEPKGVVCGHNNVVFAARSIVEYLHNTPDDIVLNVLPLSFDYGLYQLIMTLCFGGTLVLEQGATYPAVMLQRIATEKVTGFPGVPSIFAILMQLDLTQFDLASLRYVTNTAAALPSSHIERIRGKLPGVTVYSMYGLTECKRTLYLPPAQLDTRPDSVGIAIPHTEVWLEDDQGSRLGPGAVGQLVVRGSHVMRGYWNNPAATAERYRPGPTPGERILYTGDLFRMDNEGYLYFVARRDDIIKSRGEKVAPKEIEAVLYALPGVVEAAVVGIADPLFGQAIKAFLVVQGAAVSAADVQRHCKARLEDFMVPQYVEFCDSLPKTTTGKILKTGLV